MAKQVDAKRVFRQIRRFVFDSVNVKRFNVFKFGADINDESLISFQTVIDVCRNDALSPCVNSVEHRVFDSGLITYEVELNGKTPYMLSSSASAVKTTRYIRPVRRTDFLLRSVLPQNPVTRRKLTPIYVLSGG